jgi:HK97 family phage major capsid protein
MSTSIPAILSQLRSEHARKVELHNEYVEELNILRTQDAPDERLVASAIERKASVTTELAKLRADIERWEREQADDDEVARKQATISERRNPATGETERVVSGAGVSTKSRGDGWVRPDGQPAAVARGQRFADHPAMRAEAASRATADAAVIGTHGSFGQLVRAMSTSGASAVVPTVWAGEIIDLARAKSATINAGATFVPMDSKTLEIGRLTGDPTVAFRAENSEITPSDPTLDNVTLTAKTMSTLVVGSMEWFGDSIDGESIVTDAIASAIASQLDLVALYGGIEAGAGTIDLESPPNPDGVLAALLAFDSGSQVLGATAGVTATNGTTQTTSATFAELINLAYRVKNNNHEPSGLIWSPRAEQWYANTYDTTGQPMRTPDVLASIPRYTTTRIPTYTQGSLTTATDVFAGDWAQLLIGQRQEISIQVLTERYAEFGQIGIVAHWRGDIALAQPRAFAAYKALRGA